MLLEYIAAELPVNFRSYQFEGAMIVNCSRASKFVRELTPKQPNSLFFSRVWPPPQLAQLDAPCALRARQNRPIPPRLTEYQKLIPLPGTAPNPVLVLLSYVMGPAPMDLTFWPGAVAMILFATLTASLATTSGRSAWFVGVLAIMVYLIFAIALYLLPPTGTT